MVDKQKVALTTAVLIGGWHVVWSLLVFLGWGQPLDDFILWAHMIHLQITIGPFDPMASAVLILVTAAFGYAGGYFGAAVWNRTHRLLP